MTKRLTLLFILCLAAVTGFAQCNTPAIPSPHAINFACRNFTISNANLNGTGGNMLTNVTPGASISISFDWYVNQAAGCNYCPGCVVQGYWGINGQFCNCFTSFGGYGYTGGNVTSSFTVPAAEGLYYIGFGGSLDYYCNGNINTPSCSPDWAIAAIVVGNPVSTANISIVGQDTSCHSGSVFLSCVKSGHGCNGALTNLQWQKNGVDISGANDTTLTVTQPGSYTVKWFSCSEYVTASPIDIGTATVTPVGSSCAGSTTTFEVNAQTGMTYQWLLNNASINGATSSSYNTSVAGDYKVQVVNIYGCSWTSAVSTIHSLPTLTASPSATICNGSSATLTVSGASSYTWTPTTGLDNPNYMLVSASPAATVTYTVNGTDNNGCSSSATVTVNVNVNPLPNPSINVSGPTHLCYGDSVTLSSSVTAPHYSWSSGDTTTSLLTKNAANYVLTIIDDNGCFKQSTATSVTVTSLPTANLLQPSECSGISSVSLGCGPGYAIPSMWEPQMACMFEEYIDNFSFNTLDNSASGCSNNNANYTFYSNLNTLVQQGNTYNFNIESPGFFDPFGIGIWIDFNQNGSFNDPGEFVYGSPPDWGTVFGSITIPANAPSGVTHMRVRLGDMDWFSDGDANRSTDMGETEDYLITIGNGTDVTYLWTSDPAGFTSADAFPSTSPTTGTTYYLTVTDSTSGCVRTSYVSYDSSSIYPVAYGDNVWNAYAFNGHDFDTYEGYYVEPNLNFSSTDRWDANGGPSDAPGYSGCAVNSDYHSVVYKRQGFSCGYYSIDIPYHDDETALYINDSLVFSSTTCCRSDSNVWTGYLDTRSRIAYQWQENNGGSIGSLAFHYLAGKPIPGNITGTIKVCPGTSGVTYSISELPYANNYTWSLPQGATISSGGNSQDITVNFTDSAQSGTITVYAANHCGEGSASVLDVTVDPLPMTTLQPVGNTTVCTGGIVQITAPSADSYLWSNGATTASINVSDAGDYSATLSNSTGCSATSNTVTVTVNPLPAVSFGALDTVGICKTNVTLDKGLPAGGIYTGSGVNNGTFNASIGAGNHTLTYTYTNGNGCSNSTTSSITVVPLATLAIDNLSNIGICNSANLSATPLGGIFSGTNVSGTKFGPAPASTYTVTYTYTDTYGCSTSQDATVTVDTMPVVKAGTYATLGVCNAAVTLAGSPTGGIYSGTGVNSTTSKFDPSVGAGTYTISYSYTDTHGCSSTGQASITVDAAPTANAGTYSSLGTCNNAISLNGNPAGGVFSGTGVNSLTSTFDPSIGGGTYTITYSYTDSHGCNNSNQTSITVDSLPAVAIGPYTSLGVCNQAISLTQANLDGGVFTGSGVNSTLSTFDPSVGAGTYTITYSDTDMHGCIICTQAEITVDSLPAVNAGTYPAVGVCNPPFELNQGTPAGGVYMGDNVNYDIFNPAAGARTYTVAYVINDAHGCMVFASTVITVNPLPEVSTADTSVAECSMPFALTEGTPSGGVYSGIGVTNGIFDPTIGAGDYVITYNYQDQYGCENSANMTINVGVCTGVNIAKDNHEINVYPNPAHDFVTVDLKNASGINSVTVTDITGQFVATHEIITDNNHIIVVSNLPAGIYIIKINNGSNSYFKKLTVE